MEIHFGTVSSFEVSLHRPGINPLIEITGFEIRPGGGATIGMYVGADDAERLIKELRKHLKPKKARETNRSRPKRQSRR